jgi:hypothetical protein
MRHRRSGSPPPASPLTAAALAIALIVAGCGTSNLTSVPSAAPTAAPTSSPSPTTAPSPSPTPATPAPSAATACDPNDTSTPAPASPDTNDPNAALYTAIEQQVSQLRGLQATTPVERAVFDTAGLCAYIRSSFARDNPETLVDATEQLYKSLLLMPQDASLRDLYIELLTSQVAGLYDDETKRMYVVSQTGEIGPTEEITYAHEYTHALQDQAFGLRKVVGDATDQSDRTLARTTLVEGDATLLMTLWAQQNLTPAQLGEVAAGAGDPASQAVLDRMPAILREPLLFPYTSGLALTYRAFLGSGGFGGVDALFGHPPDSTEQVLHTDKLDAREEPIPVTFPSDLAHQLGDGWSVALQDTMGEYLLEILLRDAGGVDSSTSTEAAAGWGGDRIALVEGPDGATGVVLDTVWDSTKDAAEFAAALDGLVGRLRDAGRSASVLTPSGKRVVLVTAESDATMARLANVLGLAG